MSIRLIVGLGNPGKHYENTRHNVGYKVLQALAARQGLDWYGKTRYTARLADWSYRGESVWLMQPETYMNRSGEAVAPFCKDKGLSPEELLVVHDDMDFPLGKLKAAHGRGAAGHHGVQSVINAMGSAGFYRLRFGIGKSLNRKDQEDREKEATEHVLNRFRKEEEKGLELGIEKALKGIEAILTLSFDKALQIINS